MKYTKYYYIILLLILIFAFSYAFSYFMYVSSSYNETMSNSGISDKVHLNSWWQDGDRMVDNRFFTYIFQDSIDSKRYDTIEVYSVFGETPQSKNPNSLYVQFSGESYYNDTSLFDINFVPSDIFLSNIIVLPFSSYYCQTNAEIDIDRLVNKRILTKGELDNKNKFCLFSVSNPSCEARNNFFLTLSSKYKQVDSIGKLYNNLPDIDIPRNSYSSKEYLDFINRYKFMICFENVSKPNYFTEKLINAYYNNTIPIYWGCTNIDEYVNIDSILYLKPDFTQEDVDELIQQIILLDNNDDLYKKKYDSFFFKDGILPDSFDMNKLRKQVNHVLL